MDLPDIRLDSKFCVDTDPGAAIFIAIWNDNGRPEVRVLHGTEQDVRMIHPDAVVHRTEVQNVMGAHFRSRVSTVRRKYAEAMQSVDTLQTEYETLVEMAERSRKRPLVSPLSTSPNNADEDEGDGGVGGPEDDPDAYRVSESMGGPMRKRHAKTGDDGAAAAGSAQQHK